VRDEQRGAAKELVYNEKVDVVCGPINSGEVLPTLGVISGAKTLQMVGGVIDELIDPGCGLFSVPSMSCVRPGPAVEGRWSSVGGRASVSGPPAGFARRSPENHRRVSTHQAIRRRLRHAVGSRNDQDRYGRRYRRRYR
jgi:hypothetical protein